MKLGMICYEPIETVTLDTLRRIRERGLSFAEFCVNAGHSVESFRKKTGVLLEGREATGLQVGSIGRWGSTRLCPDGSVVREELENDFALIDCCLQLDCPVYVAGCNWAGELPLYKNAELAADYFSRLIDHGKGRVRIAAYNCAKSETSVYSDPMWELVLGRLEDLWIKFDPSHSYYDGRDYLAETAKWANRFAHVHIKGALKVADKRYDDPPAGMDQIDWPSFLAILYAAGYQGGLSLEPHSKTWKGELGERGLDYSIRYIKPMLLED